MAATALGIEALLQSTEWQHKICGLQPTVTRKLRAQLADAAGLRAVVQQVLSSLIGLLTTANPTSNQNASTSGGSAEYHPEIIVGITRARGSPLCLVCTGQADGEAVESVVTRRGLSCFDVIVFCVIDPLDIDSKQVTFVPAVEDVDGRLPSELIFSKLYRKELLP